MTTCPICRNAALHDLPKPHPDQAMLSDGRIVPLPLQKSRCAHCHAVVHSHPLSEEDVRKIYDREYDLALEVSPTDMDRNSGYAALIAEIAGSETPHSVLEIGCGSGHVLSTLAKNWPDCCFLGLEAAERLARNTQATTPDHIDIQWAFIEDLQAQETAFDLIFSINVLEHAHSPLGFLQACKRHLAPHGRMIIICPTAAPANLELMFLDHIHTFSKTALTHLTQDAGLRIIRHENTLPNGTAFQIAIVTHAGPDAAPAMPPETEPAQGTPTVYLEKWATLDDLLLNRLAGHAHVGAFGAGELAALLRAYTPKTWARIETLYTDVPDGSRALGRPVKPLFERPEAHALLVATHPRSQAAVGARLTAEGIPNISFHDILCC